MKRFVSIWFPQLETDWFTIRNPELRTVAFVLSIPDHGRIIVSALNGLARMQGVQKGMSVADARALVPSLQVRDTIPELKEKLLERIADWCIRYTPIVAIDLPDGIILDASGCAHLWGGEQTYLAEINNKFKKFHYQTIAAIADTPGMAWAAARFCENELIIESNGTFNALLSLPPPALRLVPEVIERMEKLGLRRISDFIGMPRSVLRRRFGQFTLTRLDQALGKTEEFIQPVQPVIPFQERLPCLEPIVTRTGIEIALEQLLEQIGVKLRKEGKGVRSAILKCFRVDGKIETVEIGTSRASNNTKHLFKLFEYKLGSIEPGLGIELFLLDAPKVDELIPVAALLWEKNGGLHDPGLSELIDRLEMKIGKGHIHRYLPDEHYWPERSIKPAISLDEESNIIWTTGRPRPLHLLNTPQKIEVTAPVPDYPPMLFQYKGKLHKVMRADGPERIEREWWLEQGQLRDYYCVEDEEGQRYWLFRAGHYSSEKNFQWYIHGFFG